MNDMVYSDLINNVQFEAFYERDKRALHVLDDMRSQPRKSVTNGIDNLVPILEKQLGIKHQYNIYLYGTDGIISKFDSNTKGFDFISEDNPSVFQEFKEKMQVLYM